MKWLASLAAAALILVPTTGLQAQIPGGAPGGINTALLKLFGNHTSFSVRATMQMADPGVADTTTVGVTMAVLEGKMRAEVNLEESSGPLLPPALIKQMKAIGMDRAVSIVRPDKARLLVIYPSLRAYADIALPKEAVAAVSASPKVQKTALGNETVAGHPCIKSKVILTDNKGRQQEATVWDATDLKQFPVQMKFVENGQNVMMRFNDIRLTKPENSQFEAPAGFTRYNDVQTLMTQKMQGKK